jgi:hypothetical protein
VNRQNLKFINFEHALCLGLVLEIIRSAEDSSPCYVSGTIIRGTLKAPNSQLVTPISIKLQRPDGCD